MSVTKQVSEFDEIGTTFGLSAGGQLCFYCGEMLADPAIMWAGMGQTIYLHAECTKDLCHGLLLDVERMRKLEEEES